MYLNQMPCSVASGLGLSVQRFRLNMVILCNPEVQINAFYESFYFIPVWNVSII